MGTKSAPATRSTPFPTPAQGFARCFVWDTIGSQTAPAPQQPSGRPCTNVKSGFNLSAMRSAKDKPKAKGKTKAKPKEDKDRPLNAGQQRFADEYLVDLNGTQAAIRAGYSPKAAAQQAFVLLRNPKVQAAIQAGREKTASKLEVTRERVLAEYAKLAFVDPRAFWNEDGTLKQVTELDPDVAATLTGFEVDEIGGADGAPSIGVTKKIKWSDKRAALDSINRMMGWNQDKLKLQGDEENPIHVATKVIVVPAKQPAAVLTKPIPKDG